MTAVAVLPPRKQQRRRPQKHTCKHGAPLADVSNRDPTLPQRQQLKEELNCDQHQHRGPSSGHRPPDRSRRSTGDSTSRQQPGGSLGPRLAGSASAVVSNLLLAAPAPPSGQPAPEVPERGMKFGKRLASEAARRWCAHYLDYKAIKKAIKEDIANPGGDRANFQSELVAELHKVSQFFSEKATQLEDTLQRLQASDPAPCSGRGQELVQLRSEVQELIKFVALNYLAVVKAIKKRNKNLQGRFGGDCCSSLSALHLLGNEVFFTSPRLAALSTQAEILCARMQATAAVDQTPAASCADRHSCQTCTDGSVRAGSRGQGQCAGSHASAGVAATVSHRDTLEEYQCPICLDTLHNPVVLTCAHRFCWGCLVAHCTSARNNRLPVFKLPSDPSAASAPAPKPAPAAAFDQPHISDLSQEPDQAHASGREAQEASRRGSLSVLEEIVLNEEAGETGTTFYSCPVCRKPQVLDVESIQVDQHLCAFIESLRATLDSTLHVSPAPTSGPAMVSAPVDAPVLEPASTPGHGVPGRAWGVLPSQALRHQGRLTVLLDVDGTLISSFTPRRAPRLPASVQTHVVGVGSQLNPQGVFVVERPGLRSFLQHLASFAEVVVFTAGLEDYARPIIDALDPDNTLFAHRIYREGCIKTDYYQCVKDMARLNRPLGRLVLVDDTPLAFLHQPDNGVPVLGFRGDPDDRLLMEAVLPLLQSLDQTPDVREVLQRRFDMAAWFRRHGFPVDQVAAAAIEAAEAERKVAQALGLPCGRAPTAEQLAAAARPTFPATSVPPVLPLATLPSPVSQPSTTARQPLTTLPLPASPAAPLSDWLLLCPFERTLVDFNPVERVVEALAPELLASIVGQGSGAEGVAMLNSVLQEMQRRGVSRDQLLVTLQELGGEVAPSALGVLSAAKQHPSARVALLSDTNSVFMAHLLAGAKASSLVDEVLTHPATFERAAGSGSSGVGVGVGVARGAAATAAASPPSPSSSTVGQKLVVQPRAAPASEPPSPAPGVGAGTGYAACCGHQTSCRRCDAGVCRGAEVRALRQRGVAKRFILCGDGKADICAAMALGQSDVVLARRGGQLAAFVEQPRKAVQGGLATTPERLPAQLLLWGDHRELEGLVRLTMRGD